LAITGRPEQQKTRKCKNYERELMRKSSGQVALPILINNLLPKSEKVASLKKSNS